MRIKFPEQATAQKEKLLQSQQSVNGFGMGDLSLSTIHEERTSQLHDTLQSEKSVTFDEKGELSFSFDGREVSVSLYETPDLTEEEALQIVEMYADQLSERVTGKQMEKKINITHSPIYIYVSEVSFDIMNYFMIMRVCMCV